MVRRRMILTRLRACLLTNTGKDVLEAYDTRTPTYELENENSRV